MQSSLLENRGDCPDSLSRRGREGGLRAQEDEREKRMGIARERWRTSASTGQAAMRI